jgi:low affinity Fe/Cu permease
VVHLKLDELIRANKRARNALLGLESMSDDELATLQTEFEQLRDAVARKRASAHGVKPKTHAPPPDVPAGTPAQSPSR